MITFSNDLDSGYTINEPPGSTFFLRNEAGDSVQSDESLGQAVILRRSSDDL
jgi:hypothetical protein